MWILSNRIRVNESGLFEDFRDCHCHLLPGVDDGVKGTKETLRILSFWETLGVKEVYLTPHIMEDIPNTPIELTTKYEILKTQYKGNIQLFLSAENMMDGLFVKRLETGDLLTLGNNGKRLLVETSYYVPPMNMDGIIYRMKENDYEPILAHPERYHYMNQHDYKQWKQQGVLFQLDVSALVGAYGSNAQKKAEWLLNHEMYDYVGSDTHGLGQIEYLLNSLISKKTVKKVKRLAEEQVL